MVYRPAVEGEQIPKPQTIRARRNCREGNRSLYDSEESVRKWAAVNGSTDTITLKRMQYDCMKDHRTDVDTYGEHECYFN